MAPCVGIPFSDWNSSMPLGIWFDTAGGDVLCLGLRTNHLEPLARFSSLIPFFKHCVSSFVLFSFFVLLSLEDTLNENPECMDVSWVKLARIESSSTFCDSDSPCHSHAIGLKFLAVALKIKLPAVSPFPS